MYAKLSIKNVKKSIGDYGIYFITVVLSSAFLYAFTSLSSEEYKFITESSMHFEDLQRILKYSSYLITGILAILIVYVNGYMIKRRFKEFGTYILLGMNQRNVALMFFIESLIIGMIGVLVGIVLGTAFSQVLTIIILISAEQEIIFKFKIYFDTVIKTIIFFIGMFALTGIFNSFSLNKLKLIDIMNRDKKTEYKFKRKPYVYVITTIICIMSYLLSAICFSKLINLIATKTISQYKMLYPVVGITFFMVGTYAFFYSISYILIILKDKYLGFKYNNTNLFLIGSLVGKLRTAPVMAATISITLMLGVLSFTISLLMSQWSLGYLEYRLPVDVIVMPFNNTDRDLNFNYDLNEVEKVLRAEQYNVDELVRFKNYSITNALNSRTYLAMKLSEYNKLRKLLGYEELILNDNEFFIHMDKEFKGYSSEDYLKEIGELKLNERIYNIKSNGLRDESLGEYLYDYKMEGPFVYILNDKVLNDEEMHEEGIFANQTEKNSYDEAIKLEGEIIPNIFKKDNIAMLSKLEKSDSKAGFITRIQSVERSEILNAMLALRVLGIYLGTVLFMISLTILGLQQLSDSIEHKKRFKILEKLGVERSEIKKIVLKQISIYFVSALLFAIIGFILFMIAYVGLFETQIMVYIGGDDFVLSLIISSIIMLVVYLSYFIATYKSFVRNIFSVNEKR